MNDEQKASAKCCYDAVAEMVVALECDYERLDELREFKEAEGLMNTEALEELHALAADAGDCENQEQAHERIQEDPLSVEVRSGWHSPGEDGVKAEEFCILLCTGGPAARIRGELNEHGEPERAWFEYQDWGTPWMQYFDADQSVLLTYCQQFYFVE